VTISRSIGGGRDINASVGLLFLILPVGIVLLGVRARIRDGGGREAGICIRRVSVRRDAGDTAG